MITMYGIKNCDTIKKAKKWLETNNVDYTFHDYRADGIDAEWLNQAIEQLGWEIVLNKRGTTFRQLDDNIKNNLTEAIAKEQMLASPAMIKRPILQIGDTFHIGFKADQYQSIFSE